MTDAVSTPAPPRSPVGRGALLRAFNANRGSWVGLAIIAAVVLAALLAPVIAPHDPLEQDLLDRLKPPSPRPSPRH